MSFDVYLVPSSATPGGREARAAAGRALTLCGARWGGSGEADIILSTGEEVEFYGVDDENSGGMFALRGGLTPELGQIVFAVADATSCFITAPLETPRMLRTPGNVGTLGSGDSEDVDAPLVVDVADVDELIDQLSDDGDRWEDYAATISEAAPAPEDDDPAINPDLLDRFFKRKKDGS